MLNESRTDATLHQLSEQPDTPFVRIDQAVVQRNIERLQRFADEVGIHLRPHIKTHKLPMMARLQRDAGARGINCQKISEAEVFAAAGFDDILITYNIIGTRKLARLRQLHECIHLTVTADSAGVVEGLSEVGRPDRPLRVLVECDTGARRCGVGDPEQALALAQRIQQTPGLHFAGVMTYPPARQVEAVSEQLQACVHRLEQAGMSVETVTTGGTPDMWQMHRMPGITEYRCGTYIYNDRSLVANGTCQIQDCALTVEATVVSCPDEGRVIVDAGSKALSSDLIGLQGHGLLPDYPQARLHALSEEHGHLDVSACPTSPVLGEQVSIIPNHACVVSNLHDRVWLADNDHLTPYQVAARGCVQ